MAPGMEESWKMLRFRFVQSSQVSSGHHHFTSLPWPQLDPRWPQISLSKIYRLSFQNTQWGLMVTSFVAFQSRANPGKSLAFFPKAHPSLQ